MPVPVLDLKLDFSLLDFWLTDSEGIMCEALPEVCGNKATWNAKLNCCDRSVLCCEPCKVAIDTFILNNAKPSKRIYCLKCDKPFYFPDCLNIVRWTKI